MSFIATAIVGSALIGAYSSNRAANTQANAANQANETNKYIYDTNRADMQPWRDAGAGVLPQLTEGLAPGGRFNSDFSMSDFQKDPGYDFRMAEGMKALERSRAAKGGLYGGATGKAIERYGQDYASGEYTNAFNRFMAQRDQQFNRLSGLAGTGQTATNQVANYGMNYANQYGANVTGAANARASGYVGGANALGSGVNSYLAYNSNNNLLNAIRPPSNSSPNINSGGGYYYDPNLQSGVGSGMG